MELTTDATIREVLLARLRALPEVFVREEHGIPGVRWNETLIADVIAVDDNLHGYEIKSDVDSLARLTKQAPLYSRVCDRVTIVAGRTHIDRVAAHVPPWWAIEEAAGSPVTLSLVREGLDSPSLDASAIVEMLWVTELRETARRLGLRRRGSKPDLTARIVAAVSLDELRAIVRTALRSRDYRREAIERDRRRAN